MICGCRKDLKINFIVFYNVFEALVVEKNDKSSFKLQENIDVDSFRFETQNGSSVDICRQSPTKSVFNILTNQAFEKIPKYL